MIGRVCHLIDIRQGVIDSFGGLVIQLESYRPVPVHVFDIVEKDGEVERESISPLPIVKLYYNRPERLIPSLVPVDPDIHALPLFLDVDYKVCFDQEGLG